MTKIINIAWKDLLTTFRDPAALIMMLATPFAITLAIGFAFGGIGRSSSSTGLADIPVILVNHDQDVFGDELVAVFQSDDLAELVAPSVSQDEASARAAVDANTAAAVVIIPANFSESIMPAAWLDGGLENMPNTPPVTRTQSIIELYANPTRPISVGVVHSIVDRFLSQAAAGSAGGEVAITRLIMSGRITPGEAQEQGPALGEQAGRAAAASRLITLESSQENAQAGFDWLSYIAPSMAIVFLMFTVSAGGRSLLTERSQGTLPRLLATPSTPFQVIGGKVLGIYLVGLAQVTILLLAGSVLFNIHWGDAQAVAVLVVALVAAASGWGMLLAAYARSPGQANATGQALSLVFAAISGNFLPRPALPEWLRTISLISPNAWGLEGFMLLKSGGSLADLAEIVGALLVMAAVLFVISASAFRRQYR